jgi:hypothetical protein
MHVCCLACVQKVEQTTLFAASARGWPAAGPGLVARTPGRCLQGHGWASALLAVGAGPLVLHSLHVDSRPSRPRFRDGRAQALLVRGSGGGGGLAAAAGAVAQATHGRAQLSLGVAAPLFRGRPVVATACTWLVSRIARTSSLGKPIVKGQYQRRKCRRWRPAIARKLPQPRGSHRPPAAPIGVASRTPG